MNISMIGCLFRNEMYAQHLNSLISVLSKKPEIKLTLITSNCSCFSTARRYSIEKEQLLTPDCVAIRIPYAPPEPSKRYGLLKYQIVKTIRLNMILEALRGIQFYRRARRSDIVHFDQVLRSFGIVSLMTLLFLSKMSGKKVIVTVHELDPLQVKHKALNKHYSWAHKLIVFSDGFRDNLIGLGVDGAKIKTVPFCVPLDPLLGLPRDQFVYFGGHHLLKGKGFDTLLGALEIFRGKGRGTNVVIYTGECKGLEEGKQRVTDLGLDGFVTWSNFIYGADLAKIYQKSIACLIPYTSGSGRHPATIAMANATPVIGTRKADLPEYLGESGVYVKEDSAQELANAMEYLANNPDVGKSLGSKLRKRAEERYSEDIVGKQLLEIYKETYAS